MFRIALLTCEDLPNLTPTDQKLIPILQKIGIEASPVIWDMKDISWSSYDALVFRNTWDYFTKQESFFSWIDMISEEKIPTFNHIDVIKNNANKFYLQELRNQGFPILPSIFIKKQEVSSVVKLIPADWKTIIIKPAISASSYMTTKIDRYLLEKNVKTYAQMYQQHDIIIQPFIPEILTKGEVSMVFFDKKFSHAVLKKAKAGDFRIQSQFGGQYAPYQPSHETLTVAESIVKHINADLLYARVDGIIIQGKFHLMELELIEPDLYFDHVENGQHRFANMIKEFLLKLPKN